MSISARQTGAFVLLIVVGACSRLLSYEGALPPNCQAIAAVGLFAGWYFASRLVAVCVPLVAMMAADLWIGGHDPVVMATVYTTLGLPAIVGGALRGRASALAIGAGALGSATLFFITSNFAVWAVSNEHTAASLWRTYVVAVPFFRYMAAGDVMYCAAIFGTFALATTASRSRAVVRCCA